MPNVTTRTAGPLTAAPPPSLTASQRRLLADTLSLGDAVQSPDPFASWSAPATLPEPARVKAVIAELDRGLQPTRPQFLKWICDKLSALPSQGANATNAAFWTDNVIDVCREYPEDLLQSACLELLKTRQWRPTPAEIVRTIEAKHSERRRMLARAKRLLPEASKPTEAPAFTPEPEEDRLRATIRRFLDGNVGSFLRPMLQRSAIAAEKRLAEIERREPGAWIRDGLSASTSEGLKPPDVELPKPSPKTQAALNRAAARRHREQGREGIAAMLEREADALAPERREEPIGDEHAEEAA